MREQRIGLLTSPSPWSPDLTSLDYYLWGYLKSKVYRTNPESIHELIQRIRDEMALIPFETNHRAISVFYQRLAYCQEINSTFSIYCNTLKHSKRF